MFEKLKELYKKQFTNPQMAELWGFWSEIKPAIVDTEFGDGLQIVGFQTLSHRPAYYVVFVDSSWSLDNNAAGELFLDHTDEIKDEIAEQYGEFHDCDYDECKEENEGESCGYHTEDDAWFPVLSDDAGTTWRLIANLKIGNGVQVLAEIRDRNNRLFAESQRA